MVKLRKRFMHYLHHELYWAGWPHKWIARFM